MASKDNGTRFVFFCPDARVLSDAEIAAIPAEKKHATENDRKEGLWLEIFCPDASCVGDDGSITIPAARTGPAKEKGIWLKLFCPEDSCELKTSTDSA